MPLQPAMSDIRRISFVTRRFNELQGLIPATFGGALLFSALMHQSLATARYSVNPFQAFTFAMLISMQSTMALQASYRRTFGEVVLSPFEKLLATTPMLLVYVGATADMFLQFKARNDGPSFAAVALAASSTWVVLRDWRWRGYHLIGVAAGLTGAIVTASVPALGGGIWRDPVRSETTMLAYSIMGLGIVVTALLDHHLLASALRSSTPEADAQSARKEQRRQALVRAAIAGVFCAAAAGCLRLRDGVLEPAFAMAMMLALAGAIVLPASAQGYRAIRDFGKRVRPHCGGLLNLGTAELIALSLIALAAAIGGVLFSEASARWLAVVIGASSGWVAIAQWRLRKYYLLGTVAAGIALPLMWSLQPARAFVLLVCAITAAVVVEGLLSFRGAADPGRANTPRDAADAHTV